ncbi:hypothetical protein [Roseobacter sp. A03A-229]
MREFNGSHAPRDRIDNQAVTELTIGGAQMIHIGIISNRMFELDFLCG